MPLPIAVGGVSLSSERLNAPYQPPPFVSSRGTTAESKNAEEDFLKPRPYQSVTWAVCPRNEWQARTAVSFYDKEDAGGSSRNNESQPQQQPQNKCKRRRMLEIRVQISPLARALSPDVYRETSYHLPLFTYDDTEDEDESRSDQRSDSSSISEDHNEDSDYSDSETDDDDHLEDTLPLQETHRQHQVVFSEDRRHLIVLLLHSKRDDPNYWQQQQQSAIIVFQLRKPKSPTNSSADIRRKIPLPSYIGAKVTPGSSSDAGKELPSQSALSNSIGGSPAIATNPKFVPSCNGVTAICRLGREPSNPDGVRQKAVPKPTFFLAMKNDGTLNWVDTHSAQITTTAQLPEIDSSHCFVSSMKASPSSTSDTGMLALVIASSNPSSESDSSQSVVSYETDNDEEDVVGIDSSIDSIGSSISNKSGGQRAQGGDCVLINWSMSSLESSSDEKQVMQVELLSVWSPPSGSGENDELRVTGVCFGSLSSVLCVVYTHSNRGDVSLGPRQKMAQILAISYKKSNGSSEGYQVIPTVSLYLSSEQVEQAPSVASIDQKMNYQSGEDYEYYESANENDSEYETSIDAEESDEFGKLSYFGATRESRLVGIQHDPSSDSFVISSIFCGSRGKNDHWVGCVWNWRANAIGWMIQHEIATLMSLSQNNIARRSGETSWSRLYFGRDPYSRGSPYLIYINSMLQYDGTNDFGNTINNNDSTILKTRKRSVPVAMLSPSNSSNPIVFTERSSLLLAENHVSFPSLASKDSDVTISELDWKISALPLSYTTSHGPPRIAAMSATRAKSIAVSSARGVCVMDTQHKKWKQFGSPTEERSFSVLAMNWWEGSLKGKKDDERDDLLVAVTQTVSGAQFLSCWSSKRLDLMHQLMDTPDLEWKPGESQDPEPSWGIPLPKDVRVTSISLLPEPELEEDRFDDHSKPRRAIALVYAPDLATAECDYLLFRLQVFRNKVSSSYSSDPYIARRPFYVMAQTTLQGSINCHDYSGPVTSAFIASACFQYDLRPSKKKKTVEIDEEDFIATIGVAHSPGGMQAMSIFKNGETCAASLTNSEVSKYQLSDRILSGVFSAINRAPINRLVWRIELLNGNVICWSTPSILGSYSDRLESLPVEPSSMEGLYNNATGSKRSKGLDRPSLICSKSTMGKNEHWLLGTLCEVGSVSDWAIQSTFGCQFDISLGHVPHLMFGCVLRCGQNSQNFSGSRDQLAGTDGQIFSSNVLESKSFSQSPFMITPPAFVISLYTLLLESAFIKMDLKEAKLSSNIDTLKNHLQNVDRQVQHRLNTVQNTDSSMMALRLIIFRSLEMIARTHKKYSKDKSESTEFNLILSKTLLTTVIDTARKCTSDIQFASLFLEIGRQTEPSNLQHLFPLPSPTTDTENKTANTVIDLFTICIDRGSLAASASALPLLTSKAEARYYCELLLDEAIDNFVRNSSPDQCKFDSTEEERRVLGDIFRFGMKLEDAEFYEEKMIAESQDGRGSTDCKSVNTADFSVSSQMYAPESPQKRNLICSLTASSSIFHYLVPSSMQGESEKQRREDAIRHEASSFIKKSLENPVLDFAMLPDWDDSFGPTNMNGVDTNSVAYLVGDALLELLQTECSTNNWKIIAAFAKLILQEGIKIPSSYDLFVEVTDKAQPLDVLSIIPESYDFDNGLEQNMSTYIEEEIGSCCRQITFADANHIMDMSLLLIDRIQLLPLPDVGDQTVLELSLAFFIIVAGDVCGRSTYIQDILDEDSLINKCYKHAVIASSRRPQKKAEF